MKRPLNIAAILALAVLITLPQSSPALSVEVIAGVVDNVSTDGTIHIIVGDRPLPSRFRLWGLDITDIEGARRFLKGRLLTCQIVEPTGRVPSAYCLADPNVRDVAPAGENQISLLVWLPELGIASHTCSKREFPTAVSDGRGRVWYCTADGRPVYNTGVFTETW